MAKKPKKPKTTVDRKIQREVAFKIGVKERSEFGEAFAKLNGLYGEIDRQFTGVKQEYKGRLEKIELEINQIAKWIRDGEQRKVVEVTERKDFDKRTVSYLHDGKVVETRDMTHDESQTELPINIEPPAKLEGKKISVRDPSSGEVNEVIQMETRRSTKKTPLDTSVN